MSTVFAISWRKGDRRLVPAAGLVLLLGTAVVHGLWTDRWGSGRDLDMALERMEQTPAAPSGWTGRELPLDTEQSEGASRVGIARIVRREFVRTADKQPVSVILMGGRFGPLSVHTPDVCYGGAGYTMHGQPIRMDVACDDGSRASFWTARFHKPNSAETAPLRIFWGWSASDGWQAPDNPRHAFRKKPVLFKLYVVREMASLNEPLDQDAGVALLKTWLPELQGTLFP